MITWGQPSTPLLWSLKLTQKTYNTILIKNGLSIGVERVEVNYAPSSLWQPKSYGKRNMAPNEA